MAAMLDAPFREPITELLTFSNIPAICKITTINKQTYFSKIYLISH